MQTVIKPLSFTKKQFAPNLALYAANLSYILVSFHFSHHHHSN